MLVVLDAHRSLIDGLAPPPIAKKQQLKTTRFFFTEKLESSSSVYIWLDKLDCRLFR